MASYVQAVCFPSQCSFATQRVTRFSLDRRFPTQITSLPTPTPTPRAWRLICAVNSQNAPSTENRRSANYQPNLWNYEFLLSLENNVAVETIQERATKLENDVRRLINRVDVEPISLLELIDDVQRLGLTYKFEKDIKRALNRIVSLGNLKDEPEKSLHASALCFRLLRQHGFEVSQDMFERYKDDEGNFKAEIRDDAQGMLSLYEASHLAFEGENMLDEAKAFSRTSLNNLKEIVEAKLAERISHALELPYHQRLHRLEARCYVDTYDKEGTHNQLLLELAKLDFNMVQLLYQEELREMTRWWKDIGLASKLSFARDRLMECFFWSFGMVPEPQFSNCRKELTKVAALITIIDDVYDVYGTLDELELFTDAVERWDVSAINTLPDYMKLCFLALYNTINEMAYDTLKELGQNSLPNLTKAWSDLCKSFLQESKWSYGKVLPEFNEYLENARFSSSGGVLLAHSYFLLSQDITEQALESLSNYHELLCSPSTIFRLCNDLATSAAELERGETTNAIPCYMRDSGVSEEETRQMLRNMIDIAWKKMNRDGTLDSTFPKPFKETCINLARIAQCTYQYGDGHGRPDSRSKNRIKSLLVDPIPVNVNY